MKQFKSNSLFVFQEQSHLFGIMNSDFDSYIPLNKLWISPSDKEHQLWKFEGKQEERQGYFIHPAMLFGFRDVKFNQSSVVFLKRISNKTSVGLIMNDFFAQITNGKVGPKVISTDLVKNFPANLPKSAFHFVKRYKRKNIMVINLEGLVNEFNIDWPE